MAASRHDDVDTIPPVVGIGTLRLRRIGERFLPRRALAAMGREGGRGTRAEPTAASNVDVDVSRITHVFFDCDDCVYQNDWATANKITRNIASYVQSLGVTPEKSYELYKTHGTCLKGLLAEGLLDHTGVDEFLHAVHTIDYDDILPDPALRSMVTSLHPHLKRYVFTASTREHAQRCLEKLDIHDCFVDIIDTRICQLETKHSPQAFFAAMRHAGISDALAQYAGESLPLNVCKGECLLIDDSVKNIITAKSLGWQTVLVGKQCRDTGATLVTPPEANLHISRIHELKVELPQLFHG